MNRRHQNEPNGVGTPLSGGLGRTLIRNTLANFAGQTTLMVLSFVATPYIVNGLGADRYGVLVLLLTYVGIFTLLQLGINTSLIKYTAELLPGGRIEEINGFLGTAVTLFSGAGLLFSGLVAFSASWIVSRLMNVSADLQTTAALGLWIASAAFLVEMIAQAFSAVPMAAQRFDVVNWVSVAAESIRFIGAVVVLYLGYSLAAVTLMILLASLFRLVAYVIAACRFIPGLSLRPRFSSEHFYSIFHFSKFVALQKTCTRVMFSLDKFVIAYFVPVSFVAFYAVPYALGLRLWTLSGNIITVIFPAASTLSAQPTRQPVHELYLRGSKAVLAVTAFPALALCCFSSDFLHFWIGAEFARNGTWVMRLLILGFLANTVAHVPDSFLKAMGNPGTPARLATLNVVSNAVLLLLLVPFFGILGAAACFLITQVALMPWLVHVINRSLRIRWTDLLAKVYLPVLATSVLSVLVSLALRPFATSLFTLALVVAVGLTAYLLLAAVFVLDRRERAMLAAEGKSLLRHHRESAKGGAFSLESPDVHGVSDDLRPTAENPQPAQHVGGQPGLDRSPFSR